VEGADTEGGDEPVKPSASIWDSRRVRILLWAAAAVLFFALTVGGAGYAGLHAGEEARRTERAEMVQSHYEAGIAALNDGDYEFARAHFRYVLQLEPDHQLATQGLAEARSRLEVQPTPTSEAARSLVEQLMEQAEEAYVAEEWTTAASTLTQLRSLDHEHRQEEVEEMLFTSLYNAGIAFLEEEDLEQGIFYMDQAVALRPLDGETVRQRNLAARYLSAMNFWGVDWEQAIVELEALHAAAPDYRDVFWRLYQAHVEYGDYLAGEGMMCPAEVAYTQALRLSSDPAVEERRAEAAQVCLIATPVPQEGDQPALTPRPIPGFDVGRLAYPVYDEETGSYDLYALYANGRILRAASAADQPWWEWGTGRLIYRDRVSNAIAMVLPEEGVPQPLTSSNGRAWPTLSPDGQRIAYAAPDAAGVWRIHVTPTYGAGETRVLAEGWAPAWGPTGLLAYTGCDAVGDTCGLVIDNPDDDQPGTRLTASAEDTAASWAPGGELLAYMTNVTGNWDIMLLNTGGGVSQFTYEPSDEGLPAWAPDGSGLAFISNRGGTWAIYVAGPDGKNVRRVLDLGAELPGWEDQRLSWAP
jgi:tetratricopeptide (TPR) repeat protein